MSITPQTQATFEKIHHLVIDTLPRQVSNPNDAPIFGSEGALDSLELVSFLADLEYRLAEEFGREVVLASEQAMSRSRSPFRDAAALTDYIVELLAK
jgi:acyl carrier protein